MIKIILVLLLFASPAFAADIGGPDESPIISLSIPFTGKLDRSTPFTSLPPGSVSEIKNMKRIAPGVPSGWTARKGMTKHNTSTALNSAEDVKSLHQYVNKDFSTRCFLAQVDNSTSGDLIYLADDDPPAYGTDFSSAAIYTMSAAAGVMFSDHINDDWVGAASGADPFAWSGGTAYPDGFSVTVGEAAPVSPTILNSGFETGAPPDNWTEFNSGATTTISRSNTQAQADTYSLKVVRTSGLNDRGGAYQDVTVLPSTNYIVTCYYYDNSDSGSILAYPVFEQYNAASALVDSTSFPQNTGDSASWRLFTSSMMEMSSTTVTLRIKLGVYCQGTHSGEVYFDTVAITAYGSGQSNWRDGYDDVRNGDTTTSVRFIEDTIDIAHIGYRRPLKGVNLYFTGTQQDVVATLTVQAMRDGAWTTVSNMSDGTVDVATSTKAFNVSGAITWDADTTDDPFLKAGVDDQLFWYKLSVDADTTDGVDVYKCTVVENCQAITNLSDGIWSAPESVFKFEGAAYTDETGDLTDSDTATVLEMATSFSAAEYVYIGCASKIFAIYMDIYTYGNSTEAAGVVGVDYWEGSSWTALTTVMDGTSDGTYAFAYSGIIQWDPEEVSENELLFTTPGIGLYPDLPLYWYRITVDDTSYLKVAEMAVMDKPETLPQYDGVIQYHSRALWWPGSTVKSGMDWSQDGSPHVMLLDGSDFATGNIFGDGTVNSTVLFGADAIVSTKDPYRIYSLTGTTPSAYVASLISDRVGAVAPHSMVFVAGGIKLFSRDALSNGVMFLAPDGFYMTNGSTVVDISSPISDYFDTSAVPYIEPLYMGNSYAWIDYDEKAVHFAVPIRTAGGAQTTLNRELIYSYFADEWYDTYSRVAPAACGINVTGSDNKPMPYIGDYAGFVYRTDYGTIDGTTGIDHYLVTSPLTPLKGQSSDYLNYIVDVRGLKLKAGADTTAGSEAKITAYADGETIGVTVGDIPLVKSGYSYIADYITVNSGTAGTPLTGEEFAFKFDNEAVDNSIMKLYGFTVDFQLRRPTY